MAPCRAPATGRGPTPTAGHQLGSRVSRDAVAHGLVAMADAARPPVAIHMGSIRVFSTSKSSGLPWPRVPLQPRRARWPRLGVRFLYGLSPGFCTVYHCARCALTHSASFFGGASPSPRPLYLVLPSEKGTYLYLAGEGNRVCMQQAPSPSQERADGGVASMPNGCGPMFARRLNGPRCVCAARARALNHVFDLALHREHKERYEV